jgi:hypothetical protein
MAIVCDSLGMSGDEKISTLRAVRAAHVRIAEARQAERDAVTAAREIGVQWWKIGDAVGMFQSNASRKYGPLPAPAGRASEKEEAAVLRKVGAANEAILKAELAEIEAVAAARRAGVTWAAIAAEVEMEQPNTVVKYRQYIEETRAVDVAVRGDAAELLRGRRIRSPRGVGRVVAAAPGG